MVFSVYDVLQADLADVSRFEKDNEGVTFLLNVVDTLSKRGWSVPLKNKKPETVLKALEPIIKETEPNALYSDRGTEFKNALVGDMLKKYDVAQLFAYSDTKAPCAEVFNRTLKQRMAKIFDTRRNGFRYLDVLPAIVENYNHTKHSTIKMSPMEAVKPENLEVLIFNYYNAPRKEVKDDDDLEIGSHVRLQLKKEVFDKQINQNSFTREVFIVISKNNTVPTTYNLVDLMGEPVEGSFYRQELQKTDNKDDFFEVEKVLEKRGNKGLVKWLGYPEKFNSWIDLDDVRR